jgi:hypothetical protein
MSTRAGTQKTLKVFLDTRDVVAMWSHLATFDLSLDSVYTLKLIQEFTLESFQASDTVEAYSHRFLDYQRKLESSEYPILEL